MRFRSRENILHLWAYFTVGPRCDDMLKRMKKIFRDLHVSFVITTLLRHGDTELAKRYARRYE